MPDRATAVQPTTFRRFVRTGIALSVTALVGFTPMAAQRVTAPRGTARRDTVPRARIDSIGLVIVDNERHLVERLMLRRRDVAPRALGDLVSEAEAVGFYRLPVNKAGRRAFCQVVMSDASTVNITFYHADGARTMDDFHHCAPWTPKLDSLMRFEEHIRRRAAQPRSVASMSVLGDSCPLFRARPRFDFQTDREVRWMANVKTWPVPDPSRRVLPPYPDGFALAQFVVDTAGRPVAGTLKMLSTPSGLNIETTRRAMKGWRFAPATIDGCTVAQLVQIPLRWR